MKRRQFNHQRPEDKKDLQSIDRIDRENLYLCKSLAKRQILERSIT
jgi:hypothetical protein